MGGTTSLPACSLCCSVMLRPVAAVVTALGTWRRQYTLPPSAADLGRATTRYTEVYSTFFETLKFRHAGSVDAEKGSSVKGHSQFKMFPGMTKCVKPLRHLVRLSAKSSRSTNQNAQFGRLSTACC